MSKKLNSQSLLELIERSKLVRADQLQRAVAELEALDGQPLSEDPQRLVEHLVATQLVTRWQADNLLRGKYKGYFLGKFKLLGLLGSGGMSSVYLAEHTLMRRKQAVKVLPKKRVDDASYLERFKLEALATAALDHPNIVRLYDIDNEAGVHYLVMEYVPGRDLQTVVAAEGPLDFIDAARYIVQAARGLQHAHDARLIHRDVKPANLLLDDHGSVKVLDLGLALFARDGEASLTLLHNENVLGTADYLAPEQALSSHDVDFRADMYSLGCTLYFLLTGHPPFPEGTLAQRIAKHQSVAPPDIRVERPNCPAGLLNICVKMMQKDPQYRYQRMQDVADALDEWVRTRDTVRVVGTEKSGLAVHTAADPAPGRGRVPPGPSASSGSGSDVLAQRAAKSSHPHPISTTESPIAETRADGPAQAERVSASRASAQQAAPESPDDSGRLDLGIEVFAGEGASQGARLLRENQRSRARQGNRRVHWIWIGVATVILCVTAILLGSWFSADRPPTRDPKHDVNSSRPVLHPRT